MIEYTFQRHYSNILMVLSWLLGAVFLVCLIIMTTYSPRWQPYRDGDAYIQPADHELPLSRSYADLTTAQPFGYPASGPVTGHVIQQANTDAQQPEITAINDLEQADPAPGPWVINLTSLRHEEQAVKFVARAQSQGVSAKTDAVTIKGDKFWRVYVPGYASANQARANAITIKEKLGLDDYWVAKR